MRRPPRDPGRDERCARCNHQRWAHCKRSGGCAGCECEAFVPPDMTRRLMIIRQSAERAMAAAEEEEEADESRATALVQEP